MTDERSNADILRSAKAHRPAMGVKPKPRLLDLFCGAGGCSVGYARAGFDVVGVDLNPMPRYPFEFHQGDALDFVREHGHEFDAIHASPPCQAYTPLQALHKHIERADLVDATREALVATGKPWAIENVTSAPLHSGIVLCGTMFDLRVFRHRRFETSILLMQPQHPRHTKTTTQYQKKAHYLAGGFVTITGDAGVYCGPAMGIDWMNGNELSQAIPPAYAEYVGHHLLAAVKAEQMELIS